MSQIINELDTIEVSNEVLQQLDIGGVYQSFSKNYRKLDDLKNFRSEYEKKNRLMRWWHNDKLRDAQLDSAEVQAEFSKTIGQLMMISIMQSKELSGQQTQLSDQQGKLKTQADGIAEHAAKLQEQHQVLAEQSKKLETLVHEYFALKGLTEDGAQKLIEIASEVKLTKDGMLREFDLRAQRVESLYDGVQVNIKDFSTQMERRINLSVEQAHAEITEVKRESHEALASYESSQRARQEVFQNALNQDVEMLTQNQREAAADLQSKQANLDSRVTNLFEKNDKQHTAHQEKLGSISGEVELLTGQSNQLASAIDGTKTELTLCFKQQKTYLSAMAAFQQEVSKSLKRLRYFAIGLTIVVVVLAGAVAHLMKWI
jgi:archaellum component FlaC